MTTAEHISTKQSFVPLAGASGRVPVFEGYSVPEGVFAGDPREQIYYILEDAGLQTNVGYWEGAPGAIKFDGFPWNEFCAVIDGHLEVREQGKPPLHLRAGQAFFIRKSFKGEWILHTVVKKYFVECLLDDVSIREQRPALEVKKT